LTERNFVIIGHRAHTAADWKLDDLCGGAGRLDVLVRCVTASLWKSHGIRKKTNVWLILNGPPSAPITVHFSGEKIRYLNPDERSTAALIRNGLIKYKKQNTPWETSPGVTMERIGLEDILMRLPNPVLLSESGKDEIGNSSTFILGDDKDPSETEMAILDKLPKINLGKESLLSSACITLIHHRLDEK
jgi:tRNA (pseudouridine54-N1)-methyltransferase